MACGTRVRSTTATSVRTSVVGADAAPRAATTTIATGHARRQIRAEMEEVAEGAGVVAVAAKAAVSKVAEFRTTCARSAGKTSRTSTIPMQRFGPASSTFFPRVMDSFVPAVTSRVTRT